MATFTALVPLRLHWYGNALVGPAGTSHRIPDAMYDEFHDEIEPNIQGGITWRSLVDDSNPAIVSLSRLTATNAIFKGTPWFDARAYGAVGDGVTDDTTALASLATALTAGCVVDFASLTYKTTAALNITVSNVLLRSGKLLGGDNGLLTITGDDVTVEDMRFERTTGPSSVTGLSVANRNGVVVSAKRFRSLNCDYKGASLACLYFSAGTADDATVRGGKFENSSAKQNACFIYAASGASNLGLLIDGIVGTGTGCPDGILLFDPSRCKVVNSRITTLTELARTNLTSWVLQSGNVYRVADRTDGTTGALFNNGSELTGNTSTPTTPGSNEYGVSGGFVYVNLGGTNPNTRTMQSRILSGYGIMAYTAGQDVNENIFAHNTIKDVDGMGIYLNLTSTSVNNQTRGNVIRRPALVGSQTANHAYAGISVNKGLDTLLQGDRIYSSGLYGVAVVLGGVGSIESVVAGSCTDTGFWIASSYWSLLNCKAISNSTHGFLIYTGNGVSSSLTDIRIEDCEGAGNTLAGLTLDNTLGTTLQVQVRGGLYRNNTTYGVNAASLSDSQIVGCEIHNNGATTGGLRVATGTRVRVADNIIHDETIGLVVSGTLMHIAGNQISASGTPYTNTATGGVKVGGTGSLSVFTCTNTPESQVTAPVGSLALRDDGGASTTLYVKQSGTGNTGWVAK